MAQYTEPVSNFDAQSITTGTPVSHQEAVRLLIVESSPYLTQVLQTVLNNSLQSKPYVRQAADPALAAAAFVSYRPQVVILDGATPGTVDLVEMIWRTAPDTKIIFWSTQHKDVMLRGITKLAPKQAVFGYTLKLRDERHLVQALRSVIECSNSYVDPSVRGNATAEAVGKQTPLTEAEFETLVDIACGLTDKAIAAKRNMSVRGVQNRITIIFQKLLGAEQELGAEGVLNLRVRAVCAASRRGLIDLDALPEIPLQIAG